MPNTPVVVRNGVTVYSCNGTVNSKDKEVIEHMLSSVGLGMEMPEHYMDIITGLTGCGPSYVSGNVWQERASKSLPLLSLCRKCTYTVVLPLHTF